MTTHSTSSDSDWLRNLMPHFLEQTKDRLTQIEAHRQAIHNGSDVIAEMKAICGIAHKISGTADTFGFRDLGVFSRNVENQCLIETQCLDAPMVVWLRIECALTPLIKEIANLIDPVIPPESKGLHK